MENEQETVTQEVDVNGGWLVTHHTKTWDTRVPLTQIDNQLDDATQERDAAQAKIDDLTQKKTELASEIAAAQAAEDAAVEKKAEATANGEVDPQNP